MMMFRFFIASLLIAIPVCLSASVLDHLKPIESIKSCQSIPNIDFIYIINLDERPEKYAHTLEELSPYGIVPWKFSALNGWKDLDIETINELGVKYEPWMRSGILSTRYPLDQVGRFRESTLEMKLIPGETYFSGGISRGVIGCALSHLSILKDAYDCGYETIWVMEDDIEVIQNPHLLTDLISELDQLVGPDGWDLLYTDREFRYPDGPVPARGYAPRPNFIHPEEAQPISPRDISPHFRRIGARFGAHSMIIRRSGIEKLLNFFLTYQMYHPIDMEMNAPLDMRLYTVLEDVVANKVGWISDNGKPKYEEE